MYPNLTPTLVALLGIALAVAAFIAVRRPFLRRLALRQIARRRGEAVLVVVGSVLGTAIIIGSLIVGDTLNFSVKHVAYKNLGPVGSTGCGATPTSTGSSPCAATRPRSPVAAAAAARPSPARASGRSTSRR